MDKNDSVIKDNLVTGKDLRYYAKKKSAKFQEQRISKARIPELEAQGWTVHRKTKKQCIVIKDKPHEKAFEDQVWTFLWKMGFDPLNGPLFKLPYTEGGDVPPKQIDVLAADDETILVVECKSSETHGKRPLQTQINELITIRNGSISHLRKLFSNKHKIKFVLATNNIILSEPDHKRLAEGNIQHFNQDDISYYEQLAGRIGQAAKYQLLGRLFKGKEIPGMDSKVPAVKGKMGEHTYYSFTIEPEKLLKIGYIVHRVNINEEDGYQRMIAKSRLKEIEKFINNKGFFPNSIIVNIDTKNGDPLRFDRVAAKHDSMISDPVVLHLPKKYHSAFIIDGQHRLYGYANTEWKRKNSIPVVAFENLPPQKQVDLFVDINSKQKPVARNLLTTIISDLFWNSEISPDAFQALKSRLLVMLGEKDDSPLYKRVMTGDRSKSPKACVTLDTVLKYGLDKTNFFAKHNKGKRISFGHLWVDPDGEGGVDYTPMLMKSYVYFRDIFDFVKSNNEIIWDLGSAPGGFLSMNIGVLCIIRLADNIIEFLYKTTGMEPMKKSAEDLANLTIEYLEPINDFIKGLDQNKINLIRKQSASAAGVENVIKELQRVINDKYKYFNPPGLEQWLKDNSGKYNDISKYFVVEIETQIRETVIADLQRVHGENWWKDGVNPRLQKETFGKKVDQKSDEPDHNFLDLLDYAEIISENWKDPLRGMFIDPEHQNSKQKEQLKWFSKLNSIRNKVSHPGRAKVTEDEFDFLVKLNGWLPARVGLAPFRMEV